MKPKHLKILYNANLSKDEFWLRRLHTFALSGNAASLILLGTFMNSTAQPIQSLQSSRLYFVPFLAGILSSMLAALFAHSSINLHISQKYFGDKVDDLEEKLEKTRIAPLGFGNYDPSNKVSIELQDGFRDARNEAAKVRKSFHWIFLTLLAISFISFGIGIIRLGYY